MTVIAELAKAGDCVNFLPIAKHIHYTEGESPTWIIHRLFEPVLRGVSYVKTHPVTFDPRRIDLAVKVAKTLNPSRIIIGSAHGKTYTGPRDRSYNFQSWAMNGFGEHFHDTVGWPLCFDRRDAEREKAHTARYITDKKPLLLLCLSCAVSSPFASHGIFAAAIQKRWGKRFKIIDICPIRCPRIYDMIALFEKSSLLITGDTAALHLATAAPTLKVITLVNDNPFLASEPRYTPLHKVRYVDALAHLPQIHEKIAALPV